MIDIVSNIVNDVLVIIFSAIYLLTNALITKTNDIDSMIVFKAIPSMLGMFLIVSLFI